MILRSVILIIASITTAAADDPFSFIVLADWHGAESFAAHPVTRKNDDDGTQGYHAAIEVLSHINENYGGDLVLLPGDTNRCVRTNAKLMQLHEKNTARGLL